MGKIKNVCKRGLINVNSVLQKKCKTSKKSSLQVYCLLSDEPVSCFNFTFDIRIIISVEVMFLYRSVCVCALKKPQKVINGVFSTSGAWINRCRFWDRSWSCIRVPGS